MTPTDRDFEEAELNLLKEALKRTHKERFLMATLLYKVQKTMSRIVITHKPNLPIDKLSIINLEKTQQLRDI